MSANCFSFCPSDPLYRGFTGLLPPPPMKILSIATDLYKTTSEFISLSSGHLTAPTLPGRLKNRDCPRDLVYHKFSQVTSMSRNSIWLKYGQTSGRPSLTRPSISGESDFRPPSTRKQITSKICCKSNINLDSSVLP